MERRRELPSVLAPTRLMVNIADFHTTFFMEDKPQLTEKVIVGKSYQKTPEFSSRIGYLVVNPNWDVPSSIARNEILPAAREDSGYFSRHDYQVLEGWGAGEKRVNPNSVDWKSLSAARLPYHFRQLDGPDNPLGRVKFIFSNLHDVYMHDTPARGLFNADRRAFSHGCIRVDNAMRLAAELLRADGRENPGLLLIQAVDEGSNRRIELNRAIPIYIVYMTAWANDLNTIEFRPDVYGRDASVLAGLDTETRSLSE
jgi:murein L,D-transpeptidase YcbB/YkuD